MPALGISPMEDIRLLVQEEGRTARNLVAFHVPINVGITFPEKGKGWARKPPTSPRLVNELKKADTARQGQRPNDSINPGTRIRSASTGRDKRSELQARYWAFLFGNLQRAVDEIYSTCESDESVTECKEAILVLDNYTREFLNLIEWFQVKRDYENTAPPQRPTSLTWEVRKSCATKTRIVPSPSSSVETDTVVIQTEPTAVQSSTTIATVDQSAVSDECNKPAVSLESESSKKLLVQEASKKFLVQEASNKLMVDEGSNKQMIHEASQTDLELCVEDADGLRFLPQPSKADRSASQPYKADRIALQPPKAEKVVPQPCKGIAPRRLGVNYAAVACPRAPRTTLPAPPAPPHVVPRPRVAPSKAVPANKVPARVNVGPLGRRSYSTMSSSSVGGRSWADKVKDKVNEATVSVEVLSTTNYTTGSEDILEGWETVKGRTRSRFALTTRSSQAKLRFNQVSASSSLPALALSEVEVYLPMKVNLVKNKVALSRHDSKSANLSSKLANATKGVASPNAAVILVKTDNNVMKQANVNLVKTEIKDVPEGTNLGNMKEDTVDVNLLTSQANSSLVNVTRNDGMKQCSTREEAKDTTAENVTKCNRNVAQEAKSKKEKENCREKMKKAKEEKSEESVLLQETFEDILEEELRKSRELSYEEAKLRKEIQELETEEGRGATLDADWSTQDIDLEASYEHVLSGMSWAERVDTLEQLHEYVARNPGRATELHQKLSSPSRRRTVPETLRRFQMKQAQAKDKREQLAKERSGRLKELHTKVEEVKAAQEANIEKRRMLLETKLKRAEANRKQHLEGIVRKAHDEDQKLKEIAFITELEAQNKRHEFMVLCQEQEDRLQGIAEERQRKQEEKAAKEAAVEERRRLLETERLEKLERMQELKREREERVGRAQQEKEKERQELAREKARDREERLSALHAAQLANQEELQKKIQLKQEESARRHEENMEHIRQRALESSILRTDDVAPRLVPYPVQKLCEICSVLIGSEVYLLSHLRGRKHQEAVQKLHEGAEREEIAMLNIRHIVDAPADKLDPRLAFDKKRQSSLKKRCKKLRQRMMSRGLDFQQLAKGIDETDTGNRSRLQKSLKDIGKLCKSQGKGQWCNTAITSLERGLGEINRVLAKPGSSKDQTLFLALNGFVTVDSVLSLGLGVPVNMAPYLPSKCFVTACSTLFLACQNHSVNARYLLLSNHVSTVLDLLLTRLMVLIPERKPGSPSSNPSTLSVDALGDALMRLLALVLDAATPGDDVSNDVFNCRMQDVISYTVSVGVVDKLALYCGGVRDPIDAQPAAAQLLLSGLELLSTLTARCGGKVGARDPTLLLVTLQVTELVGAVSMLYGMLLHQGAPPRGTPPPPLPPHAVHVALATVQLLTRIAELDLQMFQSVLGAEGISLQFRHITSYLLWYCSHDNNTELLHAVVKAVGFFAVRHRDNQMMLHSGYTPTVLQQLCNLPLPYFVNTTLSGILFPTLLACCVDNSENRAILEQEVSYQSLEDFKNSEAAVNNSLMRLLIK